MAVDRIVRPSAGADEDLEVPGFLQSGRASQAIVGELVRPDRPAFDADDDDIAPGLIEYYRPRPPVLSRAASATLVAARATGRGVGWSARHGWLVARWFGHGARATAVLGHRYVRAHDHIEALGGMNGPAWRKILDTRARRWKFLSYGAGGLAAADLASWWALVRYEHFDVFPGLAVAPAVEALAAAGLLTVYGRYRLAARLGPTQVVDPADLAEADPDDPFPIGHATTFDQAAECLSRAFHAEGIETRDISVTTRPAWGWELKVLLKGCTPAKVVAAADNLEAHMDLPAGGFMPEPHTANRSRLTVRLVERDPFADMPRPAVHAPRSLSVHDLTILGRAMDGGDLALSFDGFCALVIGAMGAGKTLGALRTFAEALTACRDAVCWDLDPLKGGLGEFGDLMALRARGPEECDAALLKALAYVEARAKVIREIGMGDRWVATEEHPDLYVFVDEYLQLSPKGKQTAIQVLRTGRQYGIYLVIAGQEATEDALGDAIASLIAYRILMPCRFEDIKICFGVGKGALGWRPDRMEPAVGQVVNDAGQSFIMGGLFTRAIRYRYFAYSPEQIASAIPGRIEAGMPQMDADTLRAAGEDVPTGGRVPTLADRLDATGTVDGQLLACVLDLYSKHRAEFVPTRLILAQLDGAPGWDPGAAPGRSLGLLISRHALDATSSKGQWGEERDVRGWTLKWIRAAAEDLLRDPP
jgi:S-DNA-T family DNA segregation ATPase FtsK/SpoIIIE